MVGPWPKKKKRIVIIGCLHLLLGLFWCCRGGADWSLLGNKRSPFGMHVLLLVFLYRVFVVAALGEMELEVQHTVQLVATKWKSSWGAEGLFFSLLWQPS